jgi:hypothetical protein
MVDFTNIWFNIAQTGRDLADPEFDDGAIKGFDSFIGFIEGLAGKKESEQASEVLSY